MANLTASVRNIGRNPIIWPLLALALLMIFNLIAIPGFFSIEFHDGRLFGSVVDILKNASPLAIIALGMTLVIALEGIDISVGSVLAIAGAMGIFMLDGYPTWIAILAALGIGVLCGLWNGMLISILGIQPMVATLILLTIGRGIAQLITGGRIIDTTSASYTFLGKGYFLGLPIQAFLILIVFALLYVLKTRTAFGLFVESVGGSKTASRYAGIRPRSIMMISYAIVGACASVAGIIVSANLGSADANNAGLWIELDAILAVVIGGTSMRGGRFYLGGTVIGALFIQSLTTTIYSLGVPAESILLVKAIVVILVCLIQSEAFRKLFVPVGKKAIIE
ncbi:ABC transporter permease [Cohnella terricola]|nr:ABC transporter permease [Cohnella terricola]